MRLPVNGHYLHNFRGSFLPPSLWKLRKSLCLIALKMKGKIHQDVVKQLKRKGKIRPVTSRKGPEGE